jgi:hypothetical protein
MSPLTVNDQLTSDSSAAPSVVLAPPAPPETVAVYVTPGVRGAVGVSVAVVVGESYVTVEGTVAPDASRSWNDVGVTVVGSSSSLKTAVTVVFRATPVAFATGEVELTVGGVWLAKMLNTGSTQ